MNNFDLDKIKQLTPQQVADHFLLLEEDPQRPRRYRFSGYGGSYWISMDRDGLVHGFKGDWSASNGLDFYMASLAGPPDFTPRQADFKLACEQLAAAFGLWKEQPRERAKKLAGRARPADEKPYRWLEDLALEIEHGRGGDRWGEMERLCGALGVDAKRITISPYRDALCWQPAVPWQGVRISRAMLMGKDGREFEGFGGWTKERAQAHLGEPGALTIWAFDLDGDTASDLAPREDLVRRLVRDLYKLGLKPAAHVWSQLKDEGRAKAHLYFRAQHAAASVDQWVACWHAIADTITQAVSRWSDVDERERGLLRIDPCTAQIQRLVRLPGYEKHGRDHVAVIEEARGHALDLDDWMASREIRLETGKDESLRFGRGLCFAVKIKHGKEGASEVRIPLARDVWPREVYRQHEDNSFGVRLRYLDPHEQVRHIICPAAAFVGGAAATAAASKLAAAGVKIITGAGADAVAALGEWRDRADAPRITMVATPGWHRVQDGWVYVAGQAVHGVQGWRADEQSAAIHARSGRGGDLAAWRAGVDRLVTTPGLRVALATSLAGALIEPLGLVPFLVHLHGRSTGGKSTAAKVAAAVWGSTRGMFQTWDVTNAGIEHPAMAASGACLVLDEVARYQGDGERLGRLIHALCSLQGRQRARQDGGRAEQRSWRLTVLSNGEQSIASRLGNRMQGGHSVRAMDVPVARGELTVSAEHAVQLERWCEREAWGVAGEAFGAYLVGLDWAEQLKELDVIADNLGRGQRWPEEAQRVLRQMALLALALKLGRDALGYSMDNAAIGDTVMWAFTRWYDGERYESEGDEGEPPRPLTPEERAWEALRLSVMSEPAHWPWSKEFQAHGSGSRDVWGWREVNGEDLELWTTEGQLNAFAARAGVGTRAFISWACTEQLAVRRKTNQAPGHIQARWIVFDVDRDRADRLLTKGVDHA